MLDKPETWVAVGFLLFIGLVLYLKVPKLITNALDDRAEKISNELKEAKILREEAHSLFNDYKKKQKEAEKISTNLIANAEKIAKDYIKESKEKLNETLDRRKKLAAEKIKRAEEEAVKEIQNKAIDIAINATSKSLSNNINDKKNSELIEDAINNLNKI